MRALSTVIAFAGKEIREVLRQPRLMAVLVVGPFVILGLFAAGYRPQPPPLRTILVMNEEAGIAQRIDQIRESLSSAVDLVDVSQDAEAARTALEAGDVDLVIVAPEEAVETITRGEKAEVLILHDKLDPFDRAYIDIFARASTDELNRRVLEEVAAAAQDRTAEYESALPLARDAAADLTAAIERNDRAGADRARLEVGRHLTSLRDGVGGSGEFLDGLNRSLGFDGRTLLNDVDESRSAVVDIDVTSPTARQDAETLEQRLAEIEEGLSTFQRISADVLVQPFLSNTETIIGEIPLTTYYSPAVLIVLLQHVVLTFAALSIVRERQLGTTELFRVGPIAVRHVLVGKFLGYALLGAVVAALLTVGIVFGFGTPMNGSWLWLGGVLMVTMTASLALGFVIAAIAKTDAQAVQFAMLALLFTIFFSGLVVSLTRLAPGVKQLAFAVPATAGTAALQDVMFRGDAPGLPWLVILGAYSIVGLGLALWRLRRSKVA